MPKEVGKIMLFYCQEPDCEERRPFYTLNELAEHRMDKHVQLELPLKYNQSFLQQLAELPLKYDPSFNPHMQSLLQQSPELPLAYNPSLNGANNA